MKEIEEGFYIIVVVIVRHVICGCVGDDTDTYLRTLVTPTNAQLYH